MTCNFRYTRAESEAPLYTLYGNPYRLCLLNADSAKGAWQKLCTTLSRSRIRSTLTKGRDFTFAANAATRPSEGDCALAQNRCTKLRHADRAISEAIVNLKLQYVRSRNSPAFLSEVVPIAKSLELPIETTALDSLHQFAGANPIYVGSYGQEVSNVMCSVYEADINSFWLSSKKHDCSYQSFFPTWLLSAYALARTAKSLGFKELVDIGSGDGRVAFCGSIVGMDSFGIEIDADLARLQESISRTTGVAFNTVEADATRYDYSRLNLSRPIFFISGLPEMGEMLASSVIERIRRIPQLRSSSGFAFMGSHAMKRLCRDHTECGWGQVISQFDLELNGTFTLPTYWTTEEQVDTPYVYASSR